MADVTGAIPERAATGSPSTGLGADPIRAALIVRLQSADPAFFETFGEDMQSGDRIRVTRAIERSSVLLRTVADNRVTSQSSLGLGIAAIMLVVLSYDVDANLDANKLMVVALDEVASELVAWNPDAMSSLQRDQLVDRIATQLERP